jgi:hypothetical protein
VEERAIAIPAQAVRDGATPQVILRKRHQGQERGDDLADRGVFGAIVYDVRLLARDIADFKANCLRSGTPMTLLMK